MSSSQSQRTQFSSTIIDYDEEDVLDKLRTGTYNLNQCVKLSQILKSKDDERVAPELLRRLDALSSDLSANFDHLDDSNFFDLDCSDEDTVVVSSLCKLVTCLESLSRGFVARKRPVSVVSHLTTLFLDTIRRIYTFVLKQENLGSDTNSATGTSTQRNIKSSQLTQFLAANSSNTQLINMYKSITEYLTLISGLIDTAQFDEDNLTEFITICNGLLELIRLSKDAKSLLLLWKLVSKYLLKYRALIAQSSASFNSFDYLKVCYDSITMNLQYIGLNLEAINKEFSDESSVSQAQFDAEIENAANLVKLVKLCGFLAKVFKTILVNFYTSSDDTNRLVSGLLVELSYLLGYSRFPTPLSSLSLHFKFYAEFNAVLDAIHVFLMSTHEYKEYLMRDMLDCDADRVKLTLYLINILPYFDANDSEFNLKVFYKLFESLDYCLVELNRPVSVVIASKSSADIQRKDDLAQMSFEAYFILSLSRFIATKLSDKNALVLALAYFGVYGSCKQSQVAAEFLLVLIKLVLLSNNSKNCFNFYKIIFGCYERTLNLSLKMVIGSLFELVEKNAQASAKLKLHDFLVKENYTRVLVIFYEHFGNGVSPKCDAYLEGVKSALGVNLDNCIFVSQSGQVLNKKMIVECVEQMRLLAKSRQLADETLERVFDANFDDLLMQSNNNSDCALIEADMGLNESQRSSKLVVFKLIKTLKAFNLNKYASGKLSKGCKRVINAFLCGIFELLMRYFDCASTGCFQMTRTLVFLLNFMQQYVISESDFVDCKLCAAHFLASLASKDLSAANGRTARPYCDADSDMNVDESDDKSILEKIMTLFCFLLNDANVLASNFALECLSEFVNKNVNQSSADFVLTEIIRSNSKMKELVGNYLRNVPHCPPADHFAILSARLEKRMNETCDGDSDEVDDEKREEINEMFKTCESTLASLLASYREMNRPQWIKARLETVLRQLNDNI